MADLLVKKDKRGARSRGYFRPEAVRHLLDEHLEGRAYHHATPWSLLMLELWHRMFVDQPYPGGG